jgi:hypothetical protein
MSTSYSPKIVTDGLVLALDAGNVKSYPSSGTTWSDLSGNLNSGSLTNGPTFNGGNGGSIVFDGTNDFVIINNPISIQSQNFTISTWINPLTPTNAITSLLDYDHATSPFSNWVIQSEDATTNRFYYIGYFDGSVFQPAGNFGVGKGIQIINSTWQNLTYIKSGTSVINYLNGNQVARYTATSATVSYLNRNFKMAGTVSGSTSRPYRGNITQTSIYNRALTAAEVLQNFNATRSRFGV